MPMTITIPAREFWDEIKEEFIYTEEKTIKIEHSLVSLSKWESRWKKSFLSIGPQTVEEMIDYVRCMTITQNVDQMVYKSLTLEDLETIKNYIDNPMTATTFSDERKGGAKRIITAENIYYWMLASNVWLECEKWHLNRLMTLLKVCSIENSPPKKMSKSQIYNRNRSLNAARKAKLNTHG